MNIQSPKEAVRHLRERGLTQQQIVDALSSCGIKTTQETVSRIGTGSIKCPGYELGAALANLASISDVA